MKIVIPFEVTIKFNNYNSDKKNKKVVKEIKTWLVDYLKNLYIPILNDTEAVQIKSIKVGVIK